MKNIKYTIITICFNEASNISNTIESVLKQKCRDYEYIIWDGMSTDDTLKIANGYKKHFESVGIDFNIISRKDSGIYNAMNRSVMCANGEWIIFLNAGDVFCNSMVLQEVYNYCDTSADVIYGRIVKKYKSVYEKSEPEDIAVITKHMPFCHQAVFTNRRIFFSFKFSERYKIASDYDLYLRAYIDRKKFKYVPIYISVFSTDGRSYNDSFGRELEFLNIRRDLHLISGFEFMVQRIIIIKYGIVDIAKRIVGKKVVESYKIIKKRMRLWVK